MLVGEKAMAASMKFLVARLETTFEDWRL